MTDLELLFLVLALLYGWECAWWVRRGSVVFRTWFGRRWRVVHPGTILGNPGAGLVFSCPLPPLGNVVAGTQLPLSLCQDTLLAFVAPAVNPGWRPLQTGRHFQFAELERVEARGKRVFANGELLLKTGSVSYASHLALELWRLRESPAGKREPAIAQLLRDTLDVKAVEQRWKEFRIRAASLQTATNFLFSYLFLFTPLLAWRLGVGHCWPGLLAGLLASTAATAFFFRRVHKHFYPSAEDERFSHCLMVLLYPAMAIRAGDLLSRPLLESFHPLALAKVFCSEPVFRKFAQDILRELRHPAWPLSPHEQAAKTEARGRELALTAVEKFLKQNQLDPDQLLQPPAPAEQNCRSYCPRCLAQFTTPTGVCDDCGGMALRPLSTRSGAS